MKRIKKIIVFLLVVTMLLSLSGCTKKQEASQSQAELYSENIDKTSKWLIDTIPEATIGSTGGEWLILGLSRSDIEVPEEYFEKYYENLCDYVQQNAGVLDTNKYTEYSRVIIALSAIGKNPADVAGYNLLVPLADFEQTIYQGLNGPIYALLALDSGNYEVPENIADSTQATRQMYVDYILSNEASEGGWSLSGNSGDVDITAMALQALSKYTEQPEVKAAIDRGVEFLSKKQNENGGFESFGAEGSESISQVITALAELGIDADDQRFVKKGNTLYGRLMEFMQEEGGFCHTLDMPKNNLMATEQAFYALVSLERFENQKPSLYRIAE